MGKKGQHRPKAPIGDAADPESLWNYMQRFSRWQLEKNYSEKTVEGRETHLGFFITWCVERGLMHPQEITKPILERYQRHLFLHRKKDGNPLSARTQIAFTTPVKAFFKWLAKANHILYNPASELELPRHERRLPRHILNVREVEAILAGPDLKTAVGIRDRAILETLYSTGMRRRELIGLQPFDLDRERGTVMIRQGKGKKDRMIPIGERALEWIAKYRDDVRPELEQAIELYRASTLGERRPIDDRTRFAAMLAHANLTITAWDGAQLVGISRCVTDFVWTTYLADLAVRVSHQRGGIGKELMRRTQAAAPQAKLLLLAAPAAEKYYPHVGFTQFAQAWMLKPEERIA